jgi:predicted ABC-class ATPase
VVGGSGDYFDVADTVIAMRDFLPGEVTDDARQIAMNHPTRRAPEGGPWRPIARRVPLPDSLDPSHGRRDVHVKARTEARLLFGSDEVELSAVEQFVEAAQVRAAGLALARARGEAIDGRRNVRSAMEAIMDALREEGLDAFQPEPTGELAEFRVFELAAFLGRIRTLRTAGVAQNSRC